MEEMVEVMATKSGVRENPFVHADGECGVMRAGRRSYEMEPMLRHTSPRRLRHSGFVGPRMRQAEPERRKT